MLNIKTVFVSILVAGLNFMPNTAFAQQYNSAVSNPFVFCAAPKPCKHCQPFRRYWEDLCSKQKNAGQGQQISPALNQEVEPVSNNSIQNNGEITLTPDQIKAEIARLTPLWNQQTALSTEAKKILDSCMSSSGRTQDGYCIKETADYDDKRLPAIAYRDEIYRLQALLK